MVSPMGSDKQAHIWDHSDSDLVNYDSLYFRSMEKIEIDNK